MVCFKSFAYIDVAAFDEDDTQQYYLSGRSTKETDGWIEQITNASYEGLRNKLSTLRKQLMDITGKVGIK